MRVDKVQPSRNGTKSCVECRRRKVRCIRISDDAPTCRRCEERGSECIAQTYRPLGSHRESSRHRISRLESQVSGLIEALHSIELKLGYQTVPQIPDPGTVDHHRQGPEIDGSDSDNTNVSEILVSDRPSHIHSLFQNNWLSLDINQENKQIQDHRRVKASARLLDDARQALQKLLPSKDDVSATSSSASEWLNILHSILPHPFIASSGQDILESYEDVRHSDVDAMNLALWLLTFAITAQQAPRESDNSAGSPRRWERLVELARTISDTVESTILSHDRLIGTLQGLALSTLWIRFQMSQGNFQKAWIRLRRTIAIAELIGVPRAFQSAQLTSCGVNDGEIHVYKIQLWEAVCGVDRLLGLVLNLPADTRRYNHGMNQDVLIDGAVQPRAYMSRLVDIAGKIQFLDDLNMAHVTNTELSRSTLELVEELKSLVRQTPESWWAKNTEHVESDHIVQFIHHYLVLRAYLPLAMRQDSGEGYLNSCFACMNACESVVQRYQFLRRMLPRGFFICEMLDLLAFTATVILILTSHGPLFTEECNVHMDKARIEKEVGQVIELMRESCTNSPVASRFAQNGISTLCSLNDLLHDGYSNNTHSPRVHQLMLDVPLLGKIHVRRNVRPRQPLTRGGNDICTETEELSNSRVSSRLGILGSSERCGPSFVGSDTLVYSAQQGSRWDTLSWFIEHDYESFYQYAMSGNAYDGLPFQG